MTTSLTAIAVALVLGATPTVHAQSAPVTVAEQLFRDGKQLMKEGRFAEACAKFEGSDHLQSSIGAQLNLGDCRAKLGQVATARAVFLEAAASSRAAGDSEREAEANRQASLLEAKLSYLTVDAAAETRALPGLAIDLDGRVLPMTALDVSMPIDPGEHTITAAAAKRTQWQGKIVIGAGERTAEIAIPALVAVAPPRPPANPGDAELIAQAIAAHQADVAEHGDAPAVAAAPDVAVYGGAPAVAAPAATAAPAIVAAPLVAVAAPDVATARESPAVDPRWSSEIGNRPLVTPHGKIEIHNGLPIFAEPTYDGAAFEGYVTNEAIGVGASYGLVDRLEIGLDTMQVLGTGGNSAVSFHAAYDAVETDALDLVADANLAFMTVPGSTDANLELGIGLRYRIDDMFSLFTGRNGAPTMPLPVDFFNHYQANIGLDNGQAIVIRVPVGFAVQATPNIYASVSTTLAAFTVSDPMASAFIGVDAIPVSVGAYFSTRMFDAGLQFTDDLENANNGYVASLAFRYYVH